MPPPAPPAAPPSTSAARAAVAAMLPAADGGGGGAADENASVAAAVERFQRGTPDFDRFQGASRGPVGLAERGASELCVPSLPLSD